MLIAIAGYGAIAVSSPDGAIAGAVAAMPRANFLGANVVGALCWGVGLVALGYFAYQVPWLRDAAFAVAAVVVVGSIIGGVVVWWRGRARTTGR